MKVIQALLILIQALLISSYMVNPIRKSEKPMMWKSNNNNNDMNSNMNYKNNNNKQLSSPSSMQSSSSSSMQANKSPMTFASYVIYKGKGAVSLKIITPSFTPIGQNRQMSKAGGLFFEFAPSIGQREYDWSRKGTFLLDVTECGTVLSLEKGVSNSYEFVHDPMMGQEGEGQTIKKMKWSTSKDGVFLNLLVSDKNKNANDAFSVPLSYGEMEVIFSIIKFCIPRFLGFHEVWTNPGMNQAMSDSPNPPNAPIWTNMEN